MTLTENILQKNPVAKSEAKKEGANVLVGGKDSNKPGGDCAC